MRYECISGPAVGIEINGQKVILYPGVEADLPDDNEYVRLFVEQGWLAEIA